MKKHAWVILGCVAIFGCGEAPQQTVKTAELASQPAIGFEALATFDRLPLLVDWPAYQDSSYSRAHENADAGNYLYTEVNGKRVEKLDRRKLKKGDKVEYVLVDTDGPGVIYRMWTTGATATEHAHPNVRFKFYFDGEAKPRLDLGARELFGEHGAKWPFVPPLSRTFQSGFLGRIEGPSSLCYVPIPFAKHVKITSNGAQFYHVNYIKYPAGTPVESFSMALAEKNRAVLDKAAAMFLTRGQMPSPPAGKMIADSRTLEIQPGKTAVLFENAGMGVVRAAWCCRFSTTGRAKTA